MHDTLAYTLSWVHGDIRFPCRPPDFFKYMDTENTFFFLWKIKHSELLLDFIPPPFTLDSFLLCASLSPCHHSVQNKPSSASSTHLLLYMLVTRNWRIWLFSLYGICIWGRGIKQIINIVRVTVVVMKHHYLGRKAFIRLTLPYRCSSIEELSTGTQTGQGPGGRN